jgi:hypothetical protein
MMRTGLAVALTVFVTVTCFPAEAEAVAAYARKHKMECSQCHSAWPLLNKFGRTFKENGYRLDREKPDPAQSPANGNGGPEEHDVQIDETLSLARALPISFRVQGRPYTKTQANPRFQMQVVHEFELEITDSTAGDFSYFANFEAADDGGWSMEVKDLVAGWHPLEQANVVAGYSTMGYSDGYNTFANRRLVQDRPSPNSAGFQSGYRFRDANPFATFYGRVGGLYYNATVGSGQGDPVGADKKDLMLRAVYDLPGGLSLGAFTLLGERALTGPVRTQDYRRSGVDMQFERRGFTANALWFRANEDHATTLILNENEAWYLQALYVIPVPRVPIVPLVRYESVESNNGAAATRGVHAGIVTYVLANINLSVEHFRQTEVAVAGTPKGSRTSVLFMLAF